MHTQRLLIASLALVIGVGIGAALVQFITVQTDYGSDSQYLVPDHSAVQARAFKTAFARVASSTSLSPESLLQVLPGLEPADFAGASTEVGHYEYRDGALVHVSTDAQPNTSIELSDVGLVALQTQLYQRLNKDPATVTIDVLLEGLGVPDAEDGADEPVSSPEDPDNTIACTMDAMQCPDGSFVGRVAPDCRFAPCPGPSEAPVTITCTPEQKAAEACIEIYAPVCGNVQVECVTTPCDPIPETFSNSCYACKEDRVISYTEGACAGDPTAY